MLERIDNVLNDGEMPNWDIKMVNINKQLDALTGYITESPNLHTSIRSFMMREINSIKKAVAKVDVTDEELMAVAREMNLTVVVPKAWEIALVRYAKKVREL